MAESPLVVQENSIIVQPNSTTNQDLSENNNSTTKLFSRSSDSQFRAENDVKSTHIDTDLVAAKLLTSVGLLNVSVEVASSSSHAEAVVSFNHTFNDLIFDKTHFF